MAGAAGSAGARSRDAPAFGAAGVTALADARRVIVRAPNWLGDAVMATPGLRALRAHAARAHIAVQLPAELAPLYAGAPFVDEIIAMDGRPRGVRALRAEARRLRERPGFDYGVCLPDSPSSALLLRLAGVRRIGGFARSGRGLVMHDVVRPPRAWGRRRMVARETFVLTLLEALGCPSRGHALELHTTAGEEAEAERLLAPIAAAATTSDSASSRRLVGLAPGASFGPSKQWPEAHFSELADALIDAGDRVVFIGSASERALVERIRAGMRHPSLSLAGLTPLGPLKAVLRRLELLVANDAGARHVAVAFGVPVVVFMGPTGLEKTNLNLERVEVLTHDVACRPCYQRRCRVEGHPCMTGIEPARAEAAARRLRSRSSGVDAPGRAVGHQGAA
jgi:heptosyltransferase-2